MEYMSTIQVRIDQKTKQSARRVLDSLGLDMSSAIKMYLRQIALRRGIPFLVLTENGLTLDQEQKILRASAEAKQGENVSPVMTSKDAVKYLKSL